MVMPHWPGSSGSSGVRLSTCSSLIRCWFTRLSSTHRIGVVDVDCRRRSCCRFPSSLSRRPSRRSAICTGLPGRLAVCNAQAQEALPCCVRRPCVSWRCAVFRAGAAGRIVYRVLHILIQFQQYEVLGCRCAVLSGPRQCSFPNFASNSGHASISSCKSKAPSWEKKEIFHNFQFFILGFVNSFLCVYRHR